MVPALKPGANWFTQPEIANGEEAVAGASEVELQGVRALIVVKDPQLCGLASGARAPPLSLSFSSLNGCCGAFAKGVRVWPGSRPASRLCCPLPPTSTLPLSLMWTPEVSLPTSRYRPNTPPVSAASSVQSSCPTLPHTG